MQRIFKEPVKVNLMIEKTEKESMIKKAKKAGQSLNQWARQKLTVG